ncbi:MAG: hypothetical protein Q8O62_11235 [Aequorivita sp.]|nr:hypothetical protein [Aequorivita sp.]
MITLDDQQQEKMVKQILTDAVIFERTSSAVNKILQSFGPDAENWEAQDHYHGFWPAINLLGFYGDKNNQIITDGLTRIFYQQVKKNNTTADKMATIIFEQWMEFLS